jgi:hypothetical protein
MTNTLALRRQTYSARNMSPFESFTMSLNLQDEQKSIFVSSFTHPKPNPIK